VLVVVRKEDDRGHVVVVVVKRTTVVEDGLWEAPLVNLVDVDCWSRKRKNKSWKRNKLIEINFLSFNFLCWNNIFQFNMQQRSMF
jgi:hypothetical protein